MRLLFCGLVVIGLGACQQNPSVSVNGERLIGKYVGNDVATFLGVPFAEPPVGELRWRAPQPLQSKVSRRDTTEFAAACMQTMRILDWYRYMAETFGASADYYDDLEISEDCLYLNLWTPTLETDAKLPVMVWIHGGGNVRGHAGAAMYDGAQLAGSQRIVLVSFNYRLGPLGWFAHPSIRDSASNALEASGNFGRLGSALL